MAKKLAPRRKRVARPREAVQSVVDETIALYHWLAWVADELYGDDARGAARRWTLRRLHRDGPQTVPDLAKVRAVRRQSLQPLVDLLVKEGLVELRSNPDHARSSLVALTDEGVKFVDRLDRIDRAVLKAVGRGLGERELTTTAETLRSLRAGFETQMKWRPAASAALDTKR
ncbi:MAG TPA: MarR family transcriptional regulator [Polyangiaceae bacterium]